MSRLKHTAITLVTAWFLMPAFVGPAGAREEVGIVEHLGSYVPPEATFRDEDGKKVTLRSLIKRPTVLSLVYFECPGLCTPVLEGMTAVFRKLPLQPGKDYDVMTVSFNEADSPKLASGKKATYLKAVGKPFSPTAWRFLTGDKGNNPQAHGRGGLQVCEAR